MNWVVVFHLRFEHAWYVYACACVACSASDLACCEDTHDISGIMKTRILPTVHWLSPLKHTGRHPDYNTFGKDTLKCVQPVNLVNPVCWDLRVMSNGHPSVVEHCNATTWFVGVTLAAQAVPHFLASILHVVCKDAVVAIVHVWTQSRQCCVSSAPVATHFCSEHEFGIAIPTGLFLALLT